MRTPLDTSTLILAAVAVVLAILAYLKDPGLPMPGAKNGFAMLAFVIPRMVVAIFLAGLMQVLAPQDFVSRHFGHAGCARSSLRHWPDGHARWSDGDRALHGRPGQLRPALSSLVAYVTPWSLFGPQRIIAWEAPLMGWRFVVARVVPSLAFPVIAGWLVSVFNHE
jgi:hypothetical protein